MNRIAIRALNVVLFVLACFLLATIVVAVLPEPEDSGASLGPRASPEIRPKTWEDRKIILERNLFNVSTLAPAVETATPDQDLEATKLPLRLLGTAVASDPQLSWAAVEDEEERRHLVVRIDDVLKDRARVVRIERRRIVLQNGPQREELALDEAQAAARSGRSPAVRTSGRADVSRQRAQRTAARERASALKSRVERLAESRFAVPREEVEEATRNPANLFSQARILPKYEEGAMVGVQVNAIKPGSLLEEIGLTNGDTISEVNGIRIGTPEDSAAVLRELTEASQFSVVVTGTDGQQRTLTYELDE